MNLQQHIEAFLLNGGIIKKCPKAKYALWPSPQRKTPSYSEAGKKDWLEWQTDNTGFNNGGSIGEEAGLHNA